MSPGPNGEENCHLAYILTLRVWCPLNEHSPLELLRLQHDLLILDEAPGTQLREDAIEAAAFAGVERRNGIDVKT